MLCDICHKREASLKYTVIISNQKTNLNLCEECAIKKELLKPSSTLNLKEFIPLIRDASQIEGLKCKECGLSYMEFIEQTKLGCPKCYTAFRDNIIPLLRKIHGSTHHIGKGPESSKFKVQSPKSKDNKVQTLKEQLKRAIISEQYEEAARIRDELKKKAEG